MSFFDDSFGGCICNLGSESGAFTGVHSELCLKVRRMVAERVLCEREACARIADKNSAQWIGAAATAVRATAAVIRARNPDEYEWIQWKRTRQALPLP